jgi:hypothetical protein
MLDGPRANAEPPMCEKCIILDAKIDQYRLLAFRMTDEPLLDELNKLIERLQAEKAALHPEQAK